MKDKRILIFILIFLLIVGGLFLSLRYNSEAEQKQSFQFTKDNQIQQIKPKKPLRIKLHRNAKGEYSWDITGENVDEIYTADKRLRKLLKID